MLPTLILSLALAFQAQSPTTTPAATTETAKEDPTVTALALKIYQQMRAGKVDPTLLSDAMQKALTPEALAQNKPMFDQLGDPTKLALEAKNPHRQGNPVDLSRHLPRRPVPRHPLHRRDRQSSRLPPQALKPFVCHSRRESAFALPALTNQPYSSTGSGPRVGPLGSPTFTTFPVRADS